VELVRLLQPFLFLYCHSYITVINFIPTAFFVTGHACWATDFYACDGLRELRRNIGMPWAAVLELHGLYVRLVISEKTHC
jgi:hypothetical protein